MSRKLKNTGSRSNHMSIYERNKKMEQISLEDINLDIIPIEVLIDVDKRITDWKAAGGKDSDAYIQQQLRYLKRVELIANSLIEIGELI